MSGRQGHGVSIADAEQRGTWNPRRESGYAAVKTENGKSPMTEEDSAEAIISKFYNGEGWCSDEGVTTDARKYEDLRPVAADYVSKCRLRVLRHIPASGHAILDMASGPIQFPEYLAYSSNFAERHCVDLSASALAQAEARIGNHGVYHHGSFLNLPFEENFFDCAISVHTIYHIDADEQEEAVRKLVRITKPGKPVVIVYNSPNPLIAAVKAALGRSPKEPPELYFHPHPNSWWRRFEDVAAVRIYPWRSFGAEAQRTLFPDNALGKVMFKVLFALEDAFPRFFANRFQYPMIVLTKR